MKLASKKTFFIIFISLMAILPSSWIQAQTLVDKIIVVVNNDVITENELQQRVLRVKNNNNIQTVDQDLQDRILKNMVEELVQLQTAQKVGITVSDAEVDVLVRRFLQQKNITQEQLSKQLLNAGLSFEDLREDLKTRSILAKLIRGDAVRSLKVSDEEIKTFAKANNIKPKNPAYDASYLLVRSPDGASNEEQNKLLAKVKSVKGKSSEMTFDELSTEFSKTNLTAERKDLGMNPSEKLPSVFSNTLAKMSPGKMSEPIKTSSGIYVLRLNEVQGGVPITEKRKSQHILIKAKSPLEIQQAKETMQRLKTQMRAGAEFGNVAKYYSDDSGSAATGGDLGWVRKGQMVPRFERELFSMQEGQVSEPIVTNFGVHIIKLNEVSRVADPEEQMRSIAYNNLMTQKMDQYYPAFLSKLMGKAYIKYL